MAQKQATQDGRYLCCGNMPEQRDTVTAGQRDTVTAGHRAGPHPHGSGSSGITAGSTLPKPIQFASHKFMALVHPHQHDINNISTKIFAGEDISIDQKPKRRQAGTRVSSAGSRASFASTRFGGGHFPGTQLCLGR